MKIDIREIKEEPINVGALGAGTTFKGSMNEVNAVYLRTDLSANLPGAVVRLSDGHAMTATSWGEGWKIIRTKVVRDEDA